MIREYIEKQQTDGDEENFKITTWVSVIA